MVKKLLILVFCLSVVSMAQAWVNFTLNPNFEISGTTEEVDLTERTFDCLGWTYWCNETEVGEGTWVVPCDDRPPARMMAVIGNWVECSIWQDDWTDYYLEANTEYIFEVDLKNVDGCSQVMIVIEDESYRYEVNKVFDIADHWDTYSIFMDTTEYVDFVGMRVGVAVRVFDSDGGRLAATNLRFHINWNDWAWAPYPESGATQVPLDVTLEWNMGTDPNHLPETDIKKHYLYISDGISEDPNATGDPNVIYVGEIDADPMNPRAFSSPLSLEPDNTYYWMVEEGLDDGEGGVYPPGSAENIAGQIWAFDSIKSYPDIIEQPEDTLVYISETAEFTVIASSPTPEEYKWYRTEDNANDTPDDDQWIGVSNVLQITNAQVGDQAYYYCVITNEVTKPEGDKEPTYTDTAKLGIKRLLAHYTLDSGDYSEGSYLDATGEHDATVTGTPVFISGMDETAEGAVAIDPINDGWANAGIWNPSQWSDQIGISAWVKWDGTAFEGDGPAIVAKRDIEDPFCWSLYSRVGDEGHEGSGTNWVRFTSWNGGDVWAGPDLLGENEWVHVVATVDEDGSHIYINGVSAGSGSWRFGSEVDDPIYIGRGSTADWLWPGALDDVRIYSYGLDRFEVADLYYAVTSENVCVDDYASEWDTDGDCKIKIDDFATVAAEWLKCGWYPSCYEE